LSGLSLINPHVLDALTRTLSQTDFPVDKIIFEVTETAAIENLAAAQTFIAMVKALGCRVSLDDFGSGYSSFAYLKNLDVDYLKIDGAFVRDVLKDKADRAMVKSMNDVGHALGLKTIAEYVENPEIFNCLSEMGVDYAQGWGVAKPERLDSLQLG
jgi:EAL domain-containing protein (putative c-di-GMP-specific phosphodiesterase class I)